MSTVVLVGNPRAGSRTAALARTLVQALHEPPTAPAGTGPVGTGPVEILELADLVGVSFSDVPSAARHPHQDPWQSLRSASLLVVATPTYKGTYTGLLKIFLDELSAGDLHGVTAVPVVIAGRADHREAVVSALSTLLSELGATLTPPLALLEPEVSRSQELTRAWADEHHSRVRHLLDTATTTPPRSEPMSADALAQDDPRERAAADLRAAFRRTAGTVSVVTTGGLRPIGFTATSLVSVSLDPPLVSLNVSRSSSSWPTVSRAPHLVAHVLGAHQESVARTFATSGIDRFAAVRWSRGPHGLPLLQDTLGTLVLAVRDRLEVGDSAVLIAEVTDLGLRDGTPLLYHDGAYLHLPGRSAARTSQP